MSTITAPTGTYTPALVRNYRASQRMGTVVHDLLTGNVDLTLRPAGPRTGSMELLFTDEPTAHACRAAHAAAVLLTFASPEAPAAAMTYTAVDTVELAEDPEIDGHWWLTVSFQEVLP